MLDKLGEQWDELVSALTAMTSEIRQGHVTHDERLPDLPEHYGPFLRLIVDTAVGDGSITELERQKLVALTVEVVDTIVAELVPPPWRPNRQPAQDAWPRWCSSA